MRRSLHRRKKNWLLSVPILILSTLIFLLHRKRLMLRTACFSRLLNRNVRQQKKQHARRLQRKQPRRKRQKKLLLRRRQMKKLRNTTAPVHPAVPAPAQVVHPAVPAPAQVAHPAVPAIHIMMTAPAVPVHPAQVQV